MWTIVIYEIYMKGYIEGYKGIKKRFDDSPVNMWNR